MKHYLILAILLSSSALGAVNISPEYKQVSPYRIESSTHLVNDIPASNQENHVNALIEVPTGTNAKWEVSKKDGQLEWEFKEGKPRLVQYLAYPANYGMIPQTKLRPEDGGDGDPLDVVVLGPAVARGSIIPAKLIGVLKMLDKGEEDHKLIAVSANTPFANIGSITELNEKFPGTTLILETWFKNYKGKKKIQILGFKGKKEAASILEKAIQGYQQDHTSQNQ